MPCLVETGPENWLVRKGKTTRHVDVLSFFLSFFFSLSLSLSFVLPSFLPFLLSSLTFFGGAEGVGWEGGVWGGVS